jgi:hypothetical protein
MMNRLPGPATQDKEGTFQLVPHRDSGSSTPDIQYAMLNSECSVASCNKP